MRTSFLPIFFNSVVMKESGLLFSLKSASCVLVLVAFEILMNIYSVFAARKFVCIDKCLLN